MRNIRKASKELVDMIEKDISEWEGTHIGEVSIHLTIHPNPVAFPPYVDYFIVNETLSVEVGTGSKYFKYSNKEKALEIMNDVAAGVWTYFTARGARIRIEMPSYNKIYSQEEVIA